MNFKRLSPVLLALGLSVSANAASTPLKLPTVNGYAVALPGVSILPVTMPSAIFSAVLPVPSLNAEALPVSGKATAQVIRPVPVIAPIVPASLPTPIALHPVKLAANADGEFALDWGLLDGTSGGRADDQDAGVLVPAEPGPKPVKPAGAMNELRDASRDRKPIRVTAEKMFDGRRETIRETALPHAKIF